MWNGVINQIVTSQGIQNGGVDISPLFLSVEKQKQSDLNLLAADALRLPFHDHSFDAVVAFEFIEHIPDVPLCWMKFYGAAVRGHIILHSPNLLSPYLPAFDMLRLVLGKGGRPVFAENFEQAKNWLRDNLRISLRKKLNPHPEFLYRTPDLSENRIGGDADSVYLANQMDIAKYLKRNNCAIDQLARDEFEE